MSNGSADLARFRTALGVRARTLQSIRTFFIGRGYLEVETPVRIEAPALELHIQAEPAGEAWLRTSPELHMKRLLAAGYTRIFQIGPCFRRGERGPLHHPEYTMLEWYRAGADYLGILGETRALLSHVAHDVLGTTRLPRSGRPPLDLAAPWAVIPVRDAFSSRAGWDPVDAFDADRFDTDLVDKVEPQLPPDRAAVLIDYPAPLAALARHKAGCPQIAERWELYLHGIELANAYSELTDAEEQRRRFDECAAQRRALGRDSYPVDHAFLNGLESGMPETGGIALGVDRLALLLADLPDLDALLPFRSDEGS